LAREYLFLDGHWQAEKNMTERVETIKQKLNRAFEPQILELVDESHKHAGHKGNQGGGGHYLVTIVSDAFAGKSPVQRHRMVYDALGEMMQHEIQALGITARTPEEA
jgi:BolA protein